MINRETEFVKELENLINCFSVENESNTPDFILAQYLRGCLTNFANIVNAREKWYGRGPKFVEPPENEPYDPLKRIEDFIFPAIHSRGASTVVEKLPSDPQEGNTGAYPTPERSTFRRELSEWMLNGNPKPERMIDPATYLEVVYFGGGKYFIPSEDQPWFDSIIRIHRPTKIGS